MRKETVTYCNSFDWEQLSEEELAGAAISGRHCGSFDTTTMHCDQLNSALYVAALIQPQVKRSTNAL